MIAARETAELAEQFIADTVENNNIEPGTLTLHAGRGTSMRSKPVSALIVELDVAKTHSRPHVSDDSPYSESQFGTSKYQRRLMSAGPTILLQCTLLLYPDRC